MIQLNDQVYYDDNTNRIFTIVGIREFEVEIEDDTECKWVPRSTITVIPSNDKTDPDLWSAVKYRMESEGFDYCFLHYSKWDDIKDQQFHKLRVDYIKAVKTLEKYINDKYEESEMDID